jgi:hypothetical protein
MVAPETDKGSFFMANSPCGGCPPCCNNCTFAASPKAALEQVPTTIVNGDTYGCVRGHGDIVTMGGTLGQLRSTGFHPVTPDGARFLRKSGNALAVHLR